MQNKQNKIFIVLVCLIIAGFIYLLHPILTPFLVGTLLAYLADPMVEGMTRRWRIPRILSVTIVFLSLFLVIIACFLMLIPLVQIQVTNFIDALPKMISWLQQSILPWLSSNGLPELINAETLKASLAENWAKAGGIVSWTFKTALHSGMAVIEWLTNIVLIPVVTFYLLRDWPKIMDNLRSLLPRHIESGTVKLLKECDDTLSAFFRGQLLVMLALGLIYSIGLTLMGLKIGLIIGIAAGLLSIVPYLGFIVGIVAASIAAFVQFGEMKAVLIVWCVFAVGQACEGMFLTPKLVGSRIGVHPVAVIFSVLAGGMLFGFFGVLLALPVAAVMMVWLRFLNQRYQASHLYK